MSRAFVKEDDGESARDLVADRAPLRPITAAGLRALRERAATERNPALRAELEKLVASVCEAIVPDDPCSVALGAAVVVRGPDGTASRYVLGGEDEVDVARGVIGVGSPLGSALVGKRAGDLAVWRRPAGDLALVVESVDYDDE